MQKDSFPTSQERNALFPGKSCFPLSAEKPSSYSDALDQLNVIFDVIGTPSREDIKDLVRRGQEKELAGCLELGLDLDMDSGLGLGFDLDLVLGFWFGLEFFALLLFRSWRCGLCRAGVYP